MLSQARVASKSCFAGSEFFLFIELISILKTILFLPGTGCPFYSDAPTATVRNDAYGK